MDISNSTCWSPWEHLSGWDDDRSYSLHLLDNVLLTYDNTYTVIPCRVNKKESKRLYLPCFIVYVVFRDRVLLFGFPP